jgi:ribosomal protein S18 acetylase RimI-like enzyme
MCRELNREDPGPAPVLDSHMMSTLETLWRDPIRGLPVVLEVGGRIEGYALLISFWSNELGGEICNIDELYVKPASRGKGCGRSIVTALMQGRSLWQQPFVAIELEVSPQNTKARALYAELGFRPVENSVLRLRTLRDFRD